MGETDECRKGRGLVRVVSGVGAAIGLVFLISEMLRIS
jgi:hypothetical protein